MNKNKIVIVHGMFMKSPIMWPLQQRLEELGFSCISINYASYQRTLAENARCAVPIVQDFSQGDSVHYLGHSLGGLFIRHLQSHWPEGFNRSRIVTLGTPHQGLSIADYLVRRGWEKPILNQAYQHGLDGHPPPWPQDIPLLSIAGSDNTGFRMARLLFGAKIDDTINDGVVGYHETQLAQAQASLLLHETHMSLLFSKALIEPIAQWLL